jgi:hypothetical protein
MNSLVKFVVLSIILFVGRDNYSQQLLSTKYEYDLSNRLEVIYYKDSAMADYGIPAYIFQYDGVGNRLYNVNYYFLPVSLLNFTANNLSNNALLTFQTASETNNSGFIIQRSYNGYQFDSIGFVEGKGNSNQLSNYRYFDYQPTNGKSGIVYYRLKQVDHDGKFELSETKVIIFEGLESEIVVYPNPTSDFIKIQTYDSVSYSYSIYSITGKLYQSGTLTNNTQLDVKDLPKGIFLLKIYNYQKSKSFKIVKL